MEISSSMRFVTFSTTSIIKLYTSFMHFFSRIKEFKSLYKYDHPRPSVTVDVAIFRPSGTEYQVLLIQRALEPFQGRYALPGGFIEINESLEEAAQRELLEETGVQQRQLTQIGTFSDPGRDPRGWVISTCFGCILESGYEDQIQAGDDAAQVAWFGINDLPQLAFDHLLLIQAAVAKLLPSPDRSKR
jgi:8-oxo-dGTP diphosphatase